MLDMARPKVQREYHLAWKAWERYCKKVDSHGGLLQLFTFDFSQIQFIVNHNSQSDGQSRSAKSGMNMRKKATYHLTSQEIKRYQGQWYLTLNKAVKNGPMKLRSDFRAAVLMKNRSHHDSGEQVEERLHQDKQRRWHSS